MEHYLKIEYLEGKNKNHELCHIYGKDSDLIDMIQKQTYCICWSFK